jgi:hypothetical protein
MKNELNTCFQQDLPRAHTESELGMLGVHGKLVKYALVQKKKSKKQISLHTSCLNSNRPVFGLKEF